jgi:Ribosomal protein L11 methyltransferase (PrmA)
MPHLPSDRVLIRASKIRLDLSNHRQVEIQVGDQTLVTSEHALAVLQTFAGPTSVGKALVQLGAKGPEDWVESSTSILHLYEAGALQDVSTPEAHDHAVGFDAAPIHVQILNDRVRTSRFIDAIERIVRAGDVVVDIGTGTGILAIAAARAGARHVYAIEEGSIKRSSRFARLDGCVDGQPVTEGNSMLERVRPPPERRTHQAQR